MIVRIKPTPEEKRRRKLMSKEEREAEDILDEAWADQIKAAANWECEVCGSAYGSQAHHIIPREDRKFRHDLFNGVSLCLKHHKFSLEISPHRNAFQFFKWLMNYRRNKFDYLLRNTTNDFSMG